MFSSKRKRFSHRLKEPFGKAGLTVAILALVMALVGGAYAAGGLTKSQEKQVTKIAKKFESTGPAGAAGTNGTNGKDGAPGAKGENGTNGTSVTNTAEPAGANCEEGGTKLVGTSTTYACNGKKGKSVALTAEPEGANCEKGGTKVEIEGNAASKKYVCNGKEGSPWTAGGTLPKGKTEKGMWSVTPIEIAAESETIGGSTVSFGIPLQSAPTVGFINEEGKERAENPVTHEFEFVTPTHCLGNAEAPTAPEGFLCLYTQSEPGTFNAVHSHSFGAFIEFEGFLSGVVISGSWAVTSSS